jgi:hypothetical protein
MLVDSRSSLATLGRARARQTDGITVYPVERLGNQLFTYAAGLAQARRLDCPFYVSLGFYGDPQPRRSYEAPYCLGSFDNGLEIPEDPAAHLPVFRGLPAVTTSWLWQRAVGRRLRKPMGGIFTEGSFVYDPRIEQIEVGTTLVGFFQSWRYFDSVAEEVRRRMLSLRKPSDWFTDMCSTIAPGDGSIILNVRRGDYLLPKNQAFHGLATRAFYARALDLVRRLGFDGTVYVMTDSMDDVLEEFAGLAELVPILPPRGTDAMELIALLARSDALVAANSSFSWWGAFLGERPGRPVVAPRPWFTAPTLDTRDLLRPDWITLDRERSTKSNGESP